ncbi:hypothetical protein JCM6882_003276 [Rhodosporidiobolus microsporus]
MQLPSAPAPARSRRARGPVPTSCDACRTAKIKCKRPKASETGGVQVNCEGCIAKGIKCTSTTNRRSSPEIVRRAPSTAKPTTKRPPPLPCTEMAVSDIPVFATDISLDSPPSTASFPSFPSTLPPTFASLASPSSFKQQLSAPPLPSSAAERPVQRAAFSSRNTAYSPYGHSSRTVASGVPIPASVAPSFLVRDASCAYPSSYPPPSTTSPSSSASPSAASSTYAVSPPQTLSLNDFLAAVPVGGAAVAPAVSIPAPSSGYTFPSRSFLPEEQAPFDEFPSSRRRHHHHHSQQQQSEPRYAANSYTGFAPPAPPPHPPSSSYSTASHTLSSTPRYPLTPMPTPEYGYSTFEYADELSRRTKRYVEGQRFGGGGGW